MSQHCARVRWSRQGQDFLNDKYSRAHRWSFDGGIEVPGSASPQLVAEPWAEACAVDPEEAFVAALSSCHMLWFLALAAKQGYCVDEYDDQAEGRMGRTTAGKLAVTRVTLRPRVKFSGRPRPDHAQHLALHHAAHEACFIANSVTSEILCEPVLDPAD